MHHGTSIRHTNHLTSAILNHRSTSDYQSIALFNNFGRRCGHCKAMVAEFKKLGEMISKDPALNSQVTIAKVDADEHRPLGERFEVQGFPTVKWFPRGRPEFPIDYQGPRDAAGFISFIKSQLEKDDSYGQIIELTVLAHKFAGSDYKDETIIAEAKKASESVKEEQKSNAAQYIKYFEKIAAKGKDYIDTEAARLQKLAAGGVATNKVVEINRKISILMTFKGTGGNSAVSDDAVAEDSVTEDAAIEEEQPAPPEDDVSEEGGEAGDDGEEGYVGEPMDMEFVGYDGENMIVNIK